MYYSVWSWFFVCFSFTVTVRFAFIKKVTTLVLYCLDIMETETLKLSLKVSDSNEQTYLGYSFIHVNNSYIIFCSTLIASCKDNRMVELPLQVMIRLPQLGHVTNICDFVSFSKNSLQQNLATS